MGNENQEKFEYVCRDYLKTLSIADLRTYGRSIGVERPTEKKKDELVKDIISVLTGAVAPIEKSTQGAPVKNVFVDPAIPAQVAELKRRLCGEETPTATESVKTEKETSEPIRESDTAHLRDYDYKEDFRKRKEAQGRITFEFFSSGSEYTGQLATVDGYARLVPLSGETEIERVFIPVKLIHSHDLREGDVITCRVKKGAVTYAEEIESVNGAPLSASRRNDFEELEVCEPKEPIRFYDDEKLAEGGNGSGKYLQWLLPAYKGQRGCICSEPKAGKTELLYEMARAARAFDSDLTVYVLLVGQSPETVTKYRKAVSGARLVYTTYEDEPERQVFAADFLLKRAKRMAESGGNVLLLVDSLSALARAYNDTAESSGGKTLASGLESKTLQYIRKYFGAARCFEKGGSLTVVGAVSEGTGSPADETVCAELRNMANLKIRLSDTLAVKRIYPAIDLKGSYTASAAGNDETDILLRTEYLPELGEQALRRAFEKSVTKAQFTERIKRELKR